MIKFCRRRRCKAVCLLETIGATDMAAKKPPNEPPALDDEKPPRRFPQDKKGGYIGVDDATALKDGETRVKKPDEKKPD